ncbi:unnamed protein product [Rotaria socialis]
MKNNEILKSAIKEVHRALGFAQPKMFLLDFNYLGYCLHNGKMKECPNRICYVYHSDKEFKTQSGCYLLPRKNAMLELKFEINFGENPGTVNGKEIGVPAKYEIVNSLFDINYFCTWNMYNDPSIMTNISEVVNLHCNVSAIKEALQAVIPMSMVTTTNKISTTLSASTSSTTSTTTVTATTMTTTTTATLSSTSATKMATGSSASFRMGFGIICFESFFLYWNNLH